MISDSYNDFLKEKLIDLFGQDECLKFMEESEKPRPTVIRANTRRIRRKDLIKLLKNRGMEVEALDWSNEGMVIYKSSVPVGATPEYLCGLYSVQGASSLLPVLNLELISNEKSLPIIANKVFDKSNNITDDISTNQIEVSSNNKKFKRIENDDEISESSKSDKKSLELEVEKQNLTRTPKLGSNNSESMDNSLSNQQKLSESTNETEKLSSQNNSKDLLNDENTVIIDTKTKNQIYEIELQEKTLNENNTSILNTEEGQKTESQSHLAEEFIKTQQNFKKISEKTISEKIDTLVESKPEMIEKRCIIESEGTTKEESTQILDKLSKKEDELHKVNKINEKNNSKETKTQVSTEKSNLHQENMPNDGVKTKKTKIKTKKGVKEHTFSVLDMCAAPGGKTTHISTILGNSGTIFAYDINKDRCKAIQSNLMRLGISNTVVICQDAREIKTPNFFDRILLDAPCSGTGVISKDPDVKTSRTYRDLDKTVRIQKELIFKAFELLKVGGTLVYSTCSVLVDENEAVVDYLIKKNIGAKLVETNTRVGQNGMTRFRGDHFHPTMKFTKRIYPHVHNMDGFFVAKIIKCKK